MYVVEYAKSGRSTCKFCNEKIKKGEIRFGNPTTFDTGYQAVPGYYWHHHKCFWRGSFNKKSWTNFDGINDLKLEDQQKLHLQIFKTPLPEDRVKLIKKEQKEKEDTDKRNQAIAEQEKEEEYEKKKEAITEFAENDPKAIMKEMLEKQVHSLKVIELKKACREHGITLDSKAKKADIQKAILRENLSNVSGIVYNGLKQFCTADELKEVLRKQSLPISGTKDAMIKRLMAAQDLETPAESQIVAAKVRYNQK